MQEELDQLEDPCYRIKHGKTVRFAGRLDVNQNPEEKPNMLSHDYPKIPFKSSFHSADEPMLPKRTDSSLRHLANLQVPDTHTASRNPFFKRHHPNFWNKSIVDLLGAKEKGIRDAEVIANDLDELVRTSNARSDALNNQSDFALQQRIADVNHQKKVLDEETSALFNTLESAQDMLKELHRMYDKTKLSKHINETCIYNREKRCGLELVNDHVEKELREELLKHKAGQEQLSHMIVLIQACIKKLKDQVQQMQQDSLSKFVTRQIDDTALCTTHHSDGLARQPEIECKNDSKITAVAWLEGSMGVIRAGMNQRHEATRLLEEAANLILRTRRELSDQWLKVNHEFGVRIQKVTEAINFTRDSLNATINQLNMMNDKYEKVHENIAHKDRFLKQAETRLKNRAARPPTENASDHANGSLRNEVKGNNDLVEELKHRIKDIMDTIQELERVKRDTEYNLANKLNALYIDRDQCLNLRSTYPNGPTVILGDECAY